MINSRHILILSFLLFLSIALQVPAQVTSPTLQLSNTPTTEEIQQRMDDLRGELSPAEGSTEAQIIATIETSLQSGRDALQRQTTFEKERRDAPALQERLRQELANVPAAAEFPTTDTLSLTDAEQSLALARADEADAARRLSELDSERQRRATRRTEIPQEIVDARQQLRELDEQSEMTPAPDAAPEMEKLQELLIEAQQLELQSKIAAWESELQSYDARTQLLATRRDLAARRATRTSELAGQWSRYVENLRQKEAEISARDARLQAATASPELAEIAARNAELAGLRAGPEGIPQKIAEVKSDLEDISQQTTRVNDQFARTREKVERIGLRDAVGLYLRNELISLPRLSETRKQTRVLQESIPDVQLKLLEIQEERRSLSDDLESEIARALSLAGFSPGDPTLEVAEQEIRTLLQSRLEILQALSADYETYFNSLVDIDVANRQLIQAVEAYREYIQEWILWIRSQSAFSPTYLSYLGSSIIWLVNDSEWYAIGQSLYVDVLLYPIPYTVAAILAIFLILIHRRLLFKLRDTSTKLSRKNDNFWPTAMAAVYTILLAFPIPLFIWALGNRLGNLTAAPDIAVTISLALDDLLIIFCVLEFIRHSFRRYGLAEEHFDWPEEALRPIRRTLTWFTPLYIGLGVIAWVMSRQPVVQWQTVFATYWFILLLAILSVLFFRFLDPRSIIIQKALEGEPALRTKWIAWFWRPMLTLIPMVLIIAAIVGYSYATIRLAQCYVNSILLITVLLILKAFLFRSIIVMRRRLALAQARRRLEQIRAKMSGDKSKDLEAPIAELEIDVDSINDQSRRMLRWGVVVLFFAGIWYIWIDVLPALNILREVHLWQETGISLQQVVSAQGEVSEETVAVTRTVTFADLLLSILIFAITFAVARNLPGLIEIGLLQRIRLDAGLRFAIKTTTRYVIVIVGVILAFGAINIGWSKVQWLAAAFTVGLGFGLQEIFANFVSGLIILFERPIRIGDIVTVGDVSGKVERLQMRATVITDFDRREFLVPNKEFVTGRLINWTLSDKVSRIMVPVGVAYGSDTEKAREIMLDVAHSNPKILGEPEPKAVFWEFGASSLDLRLYCYLPNRDNFLDVLTEIHAEIDRRFKEAELEIAFPQQDIHIRSINVPLEVVRPELKELKGPENQP